MKFSKPMSKVLAVLVVVALFFGNLAWLPGRVAAAQVAAKITVMDEGNVPISGASVVLTNQDDLSTISGTTDEFGVFERAAEIEDTATYDLTVSKDNYRDASVPNLPGSGLNDYFVTLLTNTVKFTATVTEAVGGQITQDGDVLENGEGTVTYDGDLVLVFAPDSGYYLASVSVGGIDIDPADSAWASLGNGGFQYTWRNVTSEINITATFAEAEEADPGSYILTYEDTNLWFKDETEHKYVFKDSVNMTIAPSGFDEISYSVNGTASAWAAEQVFTTPTSLTKVYVRNANPVVGEPIYYLPESFLFTLDDAAPLLTITSPLPNPALWSKTAVSVTLKAEDAEGSGVAHVYYSNVGTDYEVADFATAVGGTKGEVSLELGALNQYVYTSGDEDQDQKIYFWAVDQAGVKSARKDVTIRIDNTQPSIDSGSLSKSVAGVVSTEEYDNANVTVQGSAVDTFGELKEIRYSLVNNPDANTSTATLNSDGSFSFNVTTDGEFVYYIWAVDKAGNISESKTISVKIDRGSPRIESVTKNPTTEWTKENVTLTVEVEDEGAYGRIKTYCSTDGSTTNGRLLANNNDGTFTWEIPATAFDGTYTIWALDRANNKSAARTIVVKIDREAPEITAVTMEQQNATPVARTLNFLSMGTFFNESVKLTVTAADNNIASGLKKITLYKDGVAFMTSETIINNQAIFVLDVPLEGELTVQAEDKVGWTSPITSVADVATRIQSDRLVLESTSPTISVTTAAPLQVDSFGNKWYGADTTFQVNLADELSGIQSVVMTLNQTSLTVDSNGRSLAQDYTSSSILQDSFVIGTRQVPVAVDGRYALKVTLTDQSGNVTVVERELYIDRQAGSIRSIAFNSSGEVPPTALDNFGYYFNADTRVTITAQDQQPSSGIKSISYYLVDFSQNPAGTASAVVTQPVDGNNQISFTIPQDFKGYVLAKTTDFTAHTSGFERGVGLIVEGDQRHHETSKIELSLPQTSYRDAKGIALYQDNTTAAVAVKDSFSGLKRVEWSVHAFYDRANNQAGTILIDENGNLSGDTSGWQIDSRDKNLVTGMSSQLTARQNANQIIIFVRFEDRAGNRYEQTVEFSIDKTNPSFQLSYDNNDLSKSISGGSYYAAPRRATLTVKERNFNPEAITAQITANGAAAPSLSSWTTTYDNQNPDNTTHTAYISYSSDADYGFTIQGSDLAGRRAETLTSPNFTLDQTKPQMQISYDNMAVTHGNYYQKGRTATITITEHNFSPERTSLTGTLVQSGVAKTFPVMSSWSSQGDRHTATIVLAEDGLYSFAITTADKAGNSVNAPIQESFYIDLTAPSIVISGVQDKSANRGSLSPVIEFTDVNFDGSTVRFTLSGSNRGEVQLDSTQENLPNGVRISLADFAKTKANDDIYTLKATMTDKAGNITEKTISFSVNRFGSVYSFGDSLKNMLKRYNQKAGDLVITETNVNQLDPKKTRIKITKNGDTFDLKEGTDYRVEQSLGEGQWSRYTYVLGASLFEDDAKYTITFYSEDEAGNVNENIDEAKAAELWFGVDKTAPVIIISRLASGVTYAENSHQVLIDVSDNLVLDQVKVWLNDQEVEIAENNGQYSLEIPEANSAQKLKVSAFDAAGNEITQEIDNFYVTTSLWIRWYTNTPLLIASILGAVVVVGGGIFLIALARRRKKDSREPRKVG